jgi:hypothetical protein
MAVQHTHATTVIVAVDERPVSMRVARYVNDWYAHDAHLIGVNLARRAPSWTALPTVYGNAFAWSRAIAPDDELMQFALADLAVVDAFAGDEACDGSSVRDCIAVLLDATYQHAGDVIVIGATAPTIVTALVRSAPVPVVVVP